MILTIDIGNTETVLGLFQGLEVGRCWRLATYKSRTGDEIAVLLRALLDGEPPIAGGAIARAIAASVVPELDRAWEEALHGLSLPLTWVGPGSKLPIRLEVDEPSSVGADRVVNTLVASEIYARNTVVVDLGTATTFDCITAEGSFLGGVISPGPLAGMQRLADVASQLPVIEIRCPEQVIGRRTVSCLESGVFYSVVDAIDGIVARILAEWKPADPLVVATGGLAPLIAPHCRSVQRVEPYLTLLGLACADAHLHGGE